jgi:hypothetical protein
VVKELLWECGGLHGNCLLGSQLGICQSQKGLLRMSYRVHTRDVDMILVFILGLIHAFNSTLNQHLQHCALKGVMRRHRHCIDSPPAIIAVPRN